MIAVMKQMTLAAAADASAGFERFRKPTRRDAFLAQMQTIVPWARLVALIEPHYPKPGNGRPPVGLERMLRIHLLQHWFNLADAACEDALYDSAALRAFVGIDLGREPVPDATTILKFRHLLERHQLGQAIFAEVGRILQERGLRLSAGTIVDATIIAAPSSTKNAQQQRDPEMKQTRKGKQWYFVRLRRIPRFARDRRTSRRPAAAGAAWWHEGARGCRQQDRAGAQRGGDQRQRA